MPINNKKINLIEKALVIIPCYDMDSGIQNTIKDLNRYFKHILIIDDFSHSKVSDLNFPISINIIRHNFNTGQGGAIQTGIYAFKYFLKEFEYLITFDADGQHRAIDAFNMLKKIHTEKLEMVIGTRFKNIDSIREIPIKKRFFLKIATIIENLITGFSNTDSHNGLRVIKRNFAENIELNNFKMAHSTEILSLASSKNIKVKEYPVIIKYDHSGQSLIGAITIITDLVLSSLFRK